jgi:hypothetical protein
MVIEMIFFRLDLFNQMLKHDFRDPNRIRVAGSARRQIAGAGGESYNRHGRVLPTVAGEGGKRRSVRLEVPLPLNGARPRSLRIPPICGPLDVGEMLPLSKKNQQVPPQKVLSPGRINAVGFTREMVKRAWVESERGVHAASTSHRKVRAEKFHVLG